MSTKQTATPAVVTPAVVAPSQGVGRWAREAARAAQGAAIENNRAGNRFYGIAIALLSAAPAKGQTASISFAQVNEATGKKRGANAANPRAAWVRALSAVGELHGAPVESGVLSLPLHTGATLQVRIADGDPARAFELRTV